MPPKTASDHGPGLRGGLRRVARLAGRMTLTLGIVALAGAAVVGGRGVLSERVEAKPAVTPAPAMPVAVARIEMRDGHVAERRFAGQFEAQQRTALAFKLPGTVAEVMVREGDAVAAGDAVARLDTRLLEAERSRLAASRAALEAQAERARRTAKRQAELRDRGFATDQAMDDISLDLVRLEAEIDAVDAEIDAARIDLDKAILRAPFPGTVSDRELDVGAVAGVGAPVVTLVEDAPPRFRAALDPALAARLVHGVDATIDTGAIVLPARLARLAPSLDPATRSRTAWFDVVIGPTPPDLTTGEIALQEHVPGAGAWIPLAALRPGPQGSWTLLTVEDGVVGIEAAEVLHLDGDLAFVRGTFRDGASFLPGGTQRIVPGQAVAPLSEAAAIAARGAVAWAR